MDKKTLHNLLSQLKPTDLLFLCYDIAWQLYDTQATRDEILDALSQPPYLTKVLDSLPKYHLNYNMAIINLPPKTYEKLIGRTNELTQIILPRLRQKEQNNILAIVGLGGMGKTALAYETVEQVRQENIFDYIVWISAKQEHFVGGSTQQSHLNFTTFDDVLSQIGQQCHHIDIIKMPIEQKKSKVKELLTKYHVLIVLDNLETVEENQAIVHKLWEIRGQSKLLLTSRHRIDHTQIITINLQGLSEKEGISFLKHEAQIRNIQDIIHAPRNILTTIYQVTGGAPLAMKLVLGQISRQPLAIVLQNLQKVSQQGEDYEFYRFIYWDSWNLLSDDAKLILGSVDIWEV